MTWRNDPRMHLKFGDVLVRALVGATATSFIVTDALTLRFLCGPYNSLPDAIDAAAAAAATQRGRIWQENQDEFGREVGPPIHVPTATSEAHA